MKPTHLYVACAVIAVAVIASPFLRDAYYYAYPSGLMGEYFDACEKSDPTFSRWREGSRALCQLKNERPRP